MGRLFGTDGVRGVVGEDLTEDLARDLGRAAAAVLGDGGATVVIGRDTRASGEMLQDAFAEGVRAAGGTALLAGVQTTPAVAFLTVDVGATAGAVISASHNPPEYNGIKLFGANGMKLDDALEDRVEAVLGSGDSASAHGQVRALDGGMERYVEHLVAAAPAPLNGMAVVVDCANGAASVEAPEVLRRLGADVHAINDAPDGTNINDGCGALHPDVVAAEVLRRGADAGVAHDGDADRALFADATGAVVDGDQVLAASALALREAGRLKGNHVVSTAMANFGFRKAMADAGIDAVYAEVGDRYVLEEMLRLDAVLGGEQSGHVIFAEYATTGDGILTAVEFLGESADSGRSIAELASCMRRYPQVLVNVPVAVKEGLADATEAWDAVAATESELHGGGRVLLRPSGTERLIRVMVEAEDLDVAQSHADRIATAVQHALG